MAPELRPRTVGEVLDVAVLLYRARFRPLMAVTLIVTVPVSVVTLFVLLSALPDDGDAAVTGAFSFLFLTGSDGTAQLGALVVTTILSGLATAFVTAAATRIVADAYLGGNEGTATAVRSIGRRFIPLVVLTLITTVSIFAAWFTCLGGFVLSVVWCVAIPALILEGTGILRSLGRSFELTKVAFGVSFGVYWLSQLLVIGLSAGLAALIGLLIQSTDSASADVVAQSVSNAVAAVVTTPFLAAAVVALYFDLRVRAEGFDVQMMIAQLDQAHTDRAFTA